MTLWLGVENFGKIERAKICINKYTLLVGPNNSGKSFLMQLAEGLNEYLQIVLEDEELLQFLVQETDYNKVFKVTKDNCQKLIEIYNANLNERKESIIKEIFGKKIPIGRLYIDFALEDDIEYEVCLFSQAKNHMDELKEKFGREFDLLSNLVINSSSDDSTVTFMTENNVKNGEHTIKNVSINLKDRGLISVNRAITSIFQCSSLYMPASRNGLLLLYRDFFANKTDDVLGFSIKTDGGIQSDEDTVGLTKPVYKFLRFLQTYVSGERENKSLKSVLEFYNEKIIEGHISVDKQGIFSYISTGDGLSVPMYLASSMINELVPLYLALTTRGRYERLIIDEIEASLHPQKQLELVRFLNRLNNCGYQFIISTHSDTFVSKINNLYLLSKNKLQVDNEELMQKVGLEYSDLIDESQLFVYEFVVLESGRSLVKEIPFIQNAGFQFDLFTGSALNLFNESAKIGEMIQSDKC